MQVKNIAHVFQKILFRLTRKFRTHIPAAGGLCYRCEYRAVALETGVSARAECGMLTFAAHSCYMYTPTVPLVVKPVAGDHRPLTGLWALRARVVAVGKLPDPVLLVAPSEHGSIVYWAPGVVVQPTGEVYNPFPENSVHTPRKPQHAARRRREL